MKHSIRIASLSGIDKAAEEFLHQIGDNRLIAFHASMGAGKTTFCTALCRVLGVESDTVSSPTFAIVNEYLTSAGETVYHFDFYRIEDPDELVELGFEDYFPSTDGLTIVEWVEKAPSVLPKKFYQITFKKIDDDKRKIVFEEIEK